MENIFVAGFAFLFVFCVIYAMITDYRWHQIPNLVSVVLAVAFFPFAVVAGPAVPLVAHVGVAGAVFLLMFAFFAFGWLGGGDVKLTGAIMLWAGPGQGASFLVLVALIGGAIALGLLSLRTALAQFPQIETLPMLSTFSAWARAGKFPYALAIGAAALCVVPSIFGRF